MDRVLYTLCIVYGVGFFRLFMMINLNTGNQRLYVTLTNESSGLFGILPPLKAVK